MNHAGHTHGEGRGVGGTEDAVSHPHAPLLMPGGKQAAPPASIVAAYEFLKRHSRVRDNES